MKNGYGVCRNGQIFQMVAIYLGGEIMTNHEWAFRYPIFRKTAISSPFKSRIIHQEPEVT